MIREETNTQAAHAQTHTHTHTHKQTNEEKEKTGKQNEKQKELPKHYSNGFAGSASISHEADSREDP